MNSQFTPTAHHEFGPSVWPAASECIAFEPMPDDDPDELDVDAEDTEIDLMDGSAKARGRVKHRACAMLLAGNQEQRQAALNDLTERERNAVQWAVTRTLQIVEEHGYSPSNLRVEQRVTMFKPDGSFEPLYFGTFDAEAGPLDFDWKFGQARNYFPQLVGYALPKLEQRGDARRLGFVVYGALRRVEGYVLDRQTVDTVAYALLARRAAPVRKPTPCQYCGWCRLRATCPALVAEPVQLVARREDWSMKLPSPHVSQLHDPAWIGAARFVWKRYLEPWGNAIEFTSSAMAHNGIVAAGFKKRPERGRTTVSDTRKAFAALRELVGEDVLWAAMDTSITALARAYKAAAGISEEKAKALIIAELARAGALSVGDPTFKLFAEPNAEELIRAALAASVTLPAAPAPIPIA